MAAKKDKIGQIKTGALSRGLSLARMSISAGARAASHAVGTLFSEEEEKQESFKRMLLSQMELVSRELGQLKGSLMKAGQMLSVYGEHFLPPEVNTVLKSLQNQSPPMAWSEIEKVLRRQLGPEKLSLLEIDPEPMAAASLGQVHRARRKSDGLWVAVKVQYPGVDQAIESDLRAIRSLLSVAKLIPTDAANRARYDQLFSEVRSMLHLEVDYHAEAEATERFARLLREDSRFVVPKVLPEFSTSRVLTTTLEEGVAVDSPDVLTLSQERRNALAEAAIDLYLRELFEFRMMQTDPHFGNYRVRIGLDGGPDRLVLLDFGAIRKFPKKFIEPYREMVVGAVSRDSSRLRRGATALGMLHPDDSMELQRHFEELCYLITEPFSAPGMEGSSCEFFDSQGAYLWGESDLPKRVAKKGSQMVFGFKLRMPPRELVFLDRKMGGVFVFMSVLKARIRVRQKIFSTIR